MKKLVLFFAIIFGLIQIIDAQTLRPPTNVNAGVSGTSSLSIGINWSYVTGFSTYKILRSKGITGTYVLVHTMTNATNSSQTKWTDYNVEHGKEYCYKIKTCNDSQTCCSAESTNACANTPNLPPPTTYSISGRVVSNSDGVGVSSVTINYDGNGAQVQTDGGGYYTIPTVNSGTTGYIRATKSGYTITPASLYVSNISSNVTGKDFSAQADAPTPFITVTVPTSSTNWIKGQAYAIMWEDNITENVKLELFKGSVFVKELQPSTISDGNWAWTQIPTNLENGTNYRIKISSITSNDIYDYSSYFSISANIQQAKISVSPSSLSFGNINIGQSSSMKNFTITNTGSDPLIISSIRYPNTFAGNGFSVGTINPGISETSSVVFSPVSPVIYEGNIIVNSNAVDGINRLSVSGTGISDGNCIYNDVEFDHYAYDAVSFLCEEGMLKEDGQCEPEDPITRAALAKLAYLSISLQQNSFADDFPSPFQDLQDHSTWFYSFAKNLSYLEYQDGIAPFDKSFFNFYASNFISRAHALKVLIETWNIELQAGTDLPFTDVDINHDAYKYIYTAYKEGIISDNSEHIFGPNVNVYRGEVFVMLYKMMSTLAFNTPVPTEEDFFIPGNYTPDNFASFKALHSGNFNFYTKTSFAISSIGIPLSFEHTYNSYLTEMPEGLTPLRPLGKAWSHPYNSYVMEIPGDKENLDDFRVIIALPNSGFHVYKSINGSYECETKGVYNKLQKPTSDKFIITTKNQIIYTYQKLANSADDFPYVLKTVSDRNGNTITLNYEKSSYKSKYFRISQIIGTAGRTLKFNYHNATDLLSYIVDPIGRTVFFNYDTYDVKNGEPKLISFKDAKGQISHYNYGSREEEKFLLLSIQLPKGNVITNTYEQKKLMSTQTNGNEPTSFNYQRNYGQSSENYIQTEKTDPFGKVTTINYNKNGDPFHLETEAAIVDVNYNSSQTKKPDNMNVNGKTVSYTYDDMGNVLTMNLPLGVSHQFNYNDRNDITQYTDPRGKSYTYNYNANGNLKQAITPRGTITFESNSKGLVYSTTSPTGINVIYSYDSYGNLESSKAPEGIETSSSYDNASRLRSFTNPNGKIITYQYDPNDNLQFETFDGNTTQYNYDLNDNLTKITNAQNGVTTMGYDFQNDFLTSVSFGDYMDRYTYEDDGRLETHTDPNNQTFINDYDTKGRLESVNSGGENINYTYDANNNIASITNINGTIRFYYDLLNRVTKTIDFWGNEVQYTYDLASNLKTITYPGSKLVTYTYDDDNLMESVTDWNDNTTTYTYRDDGLLSEINYANETHCLYSYDNAGRMTGLNWKKADASLINEYTFSLDPIGNHVSEQKTEPYTTAIIEAQDQTYTYNSINRISNKGSTNFTFDANGNTKSKGNRVYQYDKFDRLTSVSGDFEAQYLYDGSGNRCASTTNGIVKRYVLDLLGMTNVLVETDASNNPLNYYIYGLGLISRIDANNHTHYYHYDYRGSTIAMTDANANISHKYQYGNYGEVLQNEEADYNPFRYVGKYGVMYEDSTLYFMRARYYDAEIGRFITEDPIWSANLYPYADCNPIVSIDPNGENPLGLTKDAIGLTKGLYDLYKSGEDISSSSSLGQTAGNTLGFVNELVSNGSKATVWMINKVDKNSKMTTGKFGKALGFAGVAIGLGTNVYTNYQEGLGAQSISKALIQTGISGLTFGLDDIVEEATGVNISDVVFEYYDNVGTQLGGQLQSIFGKKHHQMTIEEIRKNINK